MPPPITNESMPNLAKELQGRLNKLGLKDVAIRITNFLASSQNIKRDAVMANLFILLTQIVLTI